MDMRSTMGVVVMGFVSSLLVTPSAWTADSSITETAQAATEAVEKTDAAADAMVDQLSHASATLAEDHATAPTLDEIRKAIEAETDPELKTAMEEQLRLLETGQLDLTTLRHEEKDLALGAPPVTGTVPGGTTLPDGSLGTPLPMPVVDVGGGPPIGGRAGEADLPPEARKELEELFKQGTGDPTSAKDQELREKASEILEKYGIDPREVGPGHEHEGEWQERGEGFERAYLEHMAPEAREQMERFFEGEHGTFERTFEAPESIVHEASTYEAPTHEYEMPQSEPREYEQSQPYEPKESQQYQESPH